MKQIQNHNTFSILKTGAKRAVRRYRKSRKVAKNLLPTESQDLFLPQQSGKSGFQFASYSNLNNNPFTIQSEMGGAPMLQKVINPAVLKKGKKTLKAVDAKPFIPGKCPLTTFGSV